MISEEMEEDEDQFYFHMQEDIIEEDLQERDHSENDDNDSQG